MILSILSFFLLCLLLQISYVMVHQGVILFSTVLKYSSAHFYYGLSFLASLIPKIFALINFSCQHLGLSVSASLMLMLLKISTWDLFLFSRNSWNHLAVRIIKKGRMFMGLTTLISSESYSRMANYLMFLCIFNPFFLSNLYFLRTIIQCQHF